MLDGSISALRAIHLAEKAFQSGRSKDALTVLNPVLEGRSHPPSLERKIQTAQGATLFDVGRLDEAIATLRTADLLARSTGDELGLFSVHVNLLCAYNAKWQHRLVIEMTQNFIGDEQASPQFRLLRCSAHLNRAQAALALRMGSLALPAAADALRLMQLPGTIPNPIYLGMAINLLVRAHVLARNTTQAQAALSIADGMAFPPRTAVQIELARAALAAEMNDFELAFSLSQPLMDRAGSALATRRDVLSVARRIEQSRRSASRVLAVLEQLAAIVVDHRALLVRSELSMAEEARPALINVPVGTDSLSAVTTIFAKIAVVIAASEPAPCFMTRKSKAALARQFAEQLGYGTTFSERIARGAIASTFGAFTDVPPFGAGTGDHHVARIEIKETLLIFDALGIGSSEAEYRIAREHRDRCDETGPMRLGVAAISRDSFIVGIGAQYVQHPTLNCLSEASHRGFLDKIVLQAGRGFPVEIADQFALFIEPIRRSQLRSQSSFFCIQKPDSTIPHINHSALVTAHRNS